MIGPLAQLSFSLETRHIVSGLLKTDRQVAGSEWGSYCGFVVEVEKVFVFLTLLGNGLYN